MATETTTRTGPCAGCGVDFERYGPKGGRPRKWCDSCVTRKRSAKGRRGYRRLATRASLSTALSIRFVALSEPPGPATLVTAVQRVGRAQSVESKRAALVDLAAAALAWAEVLSPGWKPEQRR